MEIDFQMSNDWTLSSRSPWADNSHKRCSPKYLHQLLKNSRQSVQVFNCYCPETKMAEQTMSDKAIRQLVFTLESGCLIRMGKG